jgi:nicotinamide mononucleotide transporter
MWDSFKKYFVSSASIRFDEILAVLFCSMYSFLYLQELVVCYSFAIAGAVLLMRVYVREKLYAEAVLQVFYVIMAVYGWLQPFHFVEAEDFHFNHYAGISVGVAATLVTGALLRKFYHANLPYSDSFITVFALIGTWLMVNYSSDCWLYLMVSNIVAFTVCLMKRLWFTSVLYLLYIFFSVDGFWELNLAQGFSAWIAVHLFR